MAVLKLTGARLLFALMALLRSFANFISHTELEFDERPTMARLDLSDGNETAESEPMQQFDRQGVEQAPPPEFHPMRQDPWPWFEDDTGLVAQQMAQHINRKRAANFILVTNNAHRQAMNEFEAETA